VVRNPEISAISDVLLTALAEPSEKTKAALDTLSTTAFVHAIDAPSLALIVPILRRGLHDRATATKVGVAAVVQRRKGRGVQGGREGGGGFPALRAIAARPCLVVPARPHSPPIRAQAPCPGSCRPRARAQSRDATRTRTHARNPVRPRR
jgi:hypothetical protein